MPLHLADWVAKDATIDLQGGALADPERPRRRLRDRPRRPGRRDGRTLPVIVDPITAPRPRAAARSTSTWPARPACVARSSARCSGSQLRGRGSCITAGERAAADAGRGLARIGHARRDLAGRRRPRRPAVRDAPYNRLVLQVRADAEARLVADPLARGAAALLLLAALAAAPWPSWPSRWWCAATCRAAPTTCSRSRPTAPRPRRCGGCSRCARDRWCCSRSCRAWSAASS